MTWMQESALAWAEIPAESDPVLRALRVAAPTPRPSQEWLPARVCAQGEGDGEWLVRLPTGALRQARAAFSCLVRPQRGDLVQLAASEEGCWVLAVLERPQPGGVCRLELGAASVQLHAAELHLCADGELSLNGQQLNSRAQAIATAAQERQTHIGGTDAAHCGSLLLHADRHMGLHAKSTALSSASLLKLDAGQIHVA